MGFGFGFRLNLRLRYSAPVHSPHSFTNSPIWLSSSSGGGRETSFNSTRLTLDNDLLEREETKVNKGMRLLSSVDEMIGNTQMSFGEDLSAISTKFQSFRAQHFRLLMDNLSVLEETFADSEALSLEKDIILQLEKLGALKLFNVCLSRSFGTSSLVLDYTDEHVGESKRNCKVVDYMDKVVVPSSKKKENKTRRKRAFIATEVSSQTLPLKANQEDLLPFPASFVKGASNAKNRRTMIARREVEMSKAVKVVAELEKIRTAIENDTKQVASLSSWAEACGVDEKVLQQQLHHGRCCRDELIRSTRSLVLYIARKYRGSGIALEDLLQAGNVGVLQGAERFDSTRGYRFSTYVQYWIRKSMSRMVERYARGIIIPWSLSRALSQILKARKAMKSTSMKCPDDYEIAKMTGLSLNKIRAASNCRRIVASIDQKTGDYFSVEYMVSSPKESRAVIVFHACFFFLLFFFHIH
ncbi:RNA polymerase sigma factor sigC isoform X2 [Gastrolobium bilobum]|uniref:RNA polymerase sigma factor sigC isoform X2 n=1 Tax=Gastrolobium bilobum TaxID=150636 RepID=UPI002AB1BE55|nr:RNA polymerase sigma factor sigC isoform X2 [Gastrolobium bilobum]